MKILSHTFIEKKFPFINNFSTCLDHFLKNVSENELKQIIRLF